MAYSHDEERVRAERARAVGLFRYSLIREAADARLSTRARGRLVRAIAEREHEGPFGAPVRVSRATLDRWLRDWRRGGFDALVPTPPKVSPRTPAEVLELAAALKREVPARTAVQIATILRTHSGWSPNERTLQRHFVRLELSTRPDGSAPAAYGRFEADTPNERWTGDALHGPTVGGRKAILFAFIDDHSRLLAGYRWARREDTVRLEAALRNGLASRGLPDSVYLDYADLWVAPTSLGIALSGKGSGTG
jgi:putative transposase